jgi:hypothetical protein
MKLLMICTSEEIAMLLNDVAKKLFDVML